MITSKQNSANLILQVNKLDQPLGLIEKHEAHLKGILHRAFSVFTFRRVGFSFELLLQKRALGKYHSGGLWTNTCCSHAVEAIPLGATAQNRLKTEMGFSCDLSPAGSFYYKAQLDNSMIEHEIDHVFVGLHDPELIQPHPEEAQDYAWKNVESLLRLSKEQQKEFTVWFFPAFELALNYLKGKF